MGADGIIALQDKVGLYEDIDTKQFADNWDAICKLLSEAPAYETAKRLAELGL